MKDNNFNFGSNSQPMVNRNKVAHDQNYLALESNLQNCLSITDREYTNRSNQRCVFVEFKFANGSRSMSIQNSPQVQHLLGDFMNARGIFSKQDDGPVKG
jgi:hypothetical protein